MSLPLPPPELAEGSTLPSGNCNVNYLRWGEEKNEKRKEKDTQTSVGVGLGKYCVGRFAKLAPYFEGIEKEELMFIFYLHLVKYADPHDRILMLVFCRLYLTNKT